MTCADLLRLAADEIERHDMTHVNVEVLMLDGRPPEVSIRGIVRPEMETVKMSFSVGPK